MNIRILGGSNIHSIVDNYCFIFELTFFPLIFALVQWPVRHVPLVKRRYQISITQFL